MPGEPQPRTSDARLNILARVRRAQVRAQLPEARRDPPARLAVNPGTAADRRARLLEEFALLGVEAHVEASPEAVLRRVRGLVAGKTILSWDPDKLPYGAGEALRGEKTWFGRDPREDLPPPIFRKGILKLEDLQPGMELKGTVLNVVDFGAFVDIGLKDSGLVHISQMANRYVKSPYEVVAVGGNGSQSLPSNVASPVS